MSQKLSGRNPKLRVNHRFGQIFMPTAKLSFLTGQADENTRKSPLVAGFGKLFTSQ